MDFFGIITVGLFGFSDGLFRDFSSLHVELLGCLPAVSPRAPVVDVLQALLLVADLTLPFCFLLDLMYLEYLTAVAPYYIATPFLGDWADWTADPEAQVVLKRSAEGKSFLK